MSITTSREFSNNQYIFDLIFDKMNLNLFQLSRDKSGKSIFDQVKIRNQIFYNIEVIDYNL